MEDNEKYLIDIAKDKTYQNQYDDYHKEFAKWRARKDNPYGYSFVHDMREHTYVDGEGYFQKKADAAERIALTKCLGLLGITMLVMLFIDALSSLVMYRLFNDPSAHIIHYSEMSTPKTYFTPIVTALYGGVNLLKHLVGLWIFVHFSKIPLKVAIPSAKGSKISKSGIYLILVIMVFGKVGNYLLNVIFSWVNMDCVYAVAIHNPDSVLSDAIYVLFNCVLVSIISEFLFRGAILQTFRQFGDTFAMLVSGIAFSLTYYDISTMGYAVLCSAALGLFTIKSGSLKTTVLMRIFASIAGYSFTCVILDNYSYGRIAVTIIYTFIVAISAFIFARLMCNGKWTFRIQDDPSAITNANKLRIFFTNTSITIWLVAVIAMYFLTMRFL